MPVADLQLPSRLLAAGGPSSPDPRVLHVLGAPGIGQFDPDFTAIMDDVAALGRRTFITDNSRCFAVSGLAAAGLEAFLATLIEDGDCLAIGGGAQFFSQAADMARRYGARVGKLDELGSGTKLVVVPHIDPFTGNRAAVADLAGKCHAVGARLLVDATLAVGACELRVDDWGIDACVAGVDHAIGAPSGMALITYSSDVEALMHARRTPPRASYLDLLQLQAYWSPERLNHHTAPTSLVYGLREALRIVHEEGLADRWRRHTRVGEALQAGLRALRLDVDGPPPYAFVRPGVSEPDAARIRSRLLEAFGISVRSVAPDTWRIGLLGADARADNVRRVVSGLEDALRQAA